MMSTTVAMSTTAVVEPPCATHVRIMAAAATCVTIGVILCAAFAALLSHGNYDIGNIVGIVALGIMGVSITLCCGLLAVSSCHEILVPVCSRMVTLGADV